MATGVATITIKCRLRGLGETLEFDHSHTITSLKAERVYTDYVSLASQHFAMPASGLKGIYVRNISAMTSNVRSATLYVGLGSTIMSAAVSSVVSGAQAALGPGEAMFMPVNVIRALSTGASATSSFYSTCGIASLYGVNYEFITFGF